jgi:hypothetical protein
METSHPPPPPQMRQGLLMILNLFMALWFQQNLTPFISPHLIYFTIPEIVFSFLFYPSSSLPVSLHSAQRSYCIPLTLQNLSISQQGYFNNAQWPTTHPLISYCVAQPSHVRHKHTCQYTSTDHHNVTDSPLLLSILYSIFISSCTPTFLWWSYCEHKCNKILQNVSDHLLIAMV